MQALSASPSPSIGPRECEPTFFLFCRDMPIKRLQLDSIQAIRMTCEIPSAPPLFVLF